MPAARLAALLVLCLPMASCLSDRSSPAAGAPVRPPEILTYWCSDGGPLKLERMATSVRMPDVEGGVELPAAPTGQTARFARGPYALTFEGQQATLSKQGSPTIACTR